MEKSLQLFRRTNEHIERGKGKVGEETVLVDCTPNVLKEKHGYRC